MSEHNPWTTLSSRVTYENEWMRVREDAVKRPDGSDGIYGVMEARKVAVGVVALTETGEVVLVGQWRYPTEVYSWEIVEGGADPGEDPIAAAKRELREEAGLEAEHWEPLGGEVHLSNSITAEICFLYLATELKEVGADPDPTEILTLDRVPLAEAVRRAVSGEITDAMSIMGLFLATRC